MPLVHCVMLLVTHQPHLHQPWQLNRHKYTHSRALTHVAAHQSGVAQDVKECVYVHGDLSDGAVVTHQPHPSRRKFLSSFLGSDSELL